ncbi:hypothetical protein Dsin_017278 [Dipteronia sinensis]|uniref:Uncharacterized protein n=1 Tax=Dipteronia sinensis TaxID=43782 RepID=A0AAE0E6J4_9ROSI|nr:hypothetical protein Dsin_017278 [Dipteronia sinensis]
MEKSFQDIFDILSKVSINLPLLDAIQKMPAYGKFFKELSKDKERFRPRQQERLNMNEKKTPLRDLKRKFTKESTASKVAKTKAETSAPMASCAWKTTWLVVGLEAYHIEVRLEDLDEEDDQQERLTDPILREQRS